jgi:hypothetical protein
MQSRIFEAEDTRRDRKACVEAKQVAVVGHPSDGESLKTSKNALEGLVSLVIRKGYFRLSVGLFGDLGLSVYDRSDRCVAPA